MDRGVCCARREIREIRLLTGMDMDSRVWGPIPTELLQLVFSYLPVLDICKLRVLSKTWKQNIDSVDTEFSQLLEETTYPRMFGAISLKSEGQFCGMIVDVKARQRQLNPNNSCTACALEIVPSDNYVTTMGASDGGLVCFVSRGTMRPKFIVVMNPLTGKKIELPGLRSMEGGHVASNVMPLMVQLTMDRQTWQYKVIIVGYMDGGATGKRLFAQVYDSVIKGWTVVGSAELQQQNCQDRIYGYAYRSLINRERRLNCLALIGSCMYDFAAVGGGLHYFRKNSGGELDGGPYQPYPAAQGVPLVLPFAPEDNIAHAVLKNHLFVLRSDSELSSSMPGFYHYFIAEYVLEKDATAWVEVGRIHNLPFHEKLIPIYRSVSFFLDACKGFLVLFLNHNLGYIYDLSGCCWLELPRIHPRPSWSYHCRNLGPVDLLCELRWNATP